ncbi:MAG: integrase core domain-containing protein [Patescibacteria group bacterium]
MSTVYAAYGAADLARIPTLGKEAKKRLAWMDYYRAHGKNASLACRHFGISRQCFHKWKKRYDPYRLESLEEKSRRPKRTRQWEVSRRDEFRILRLRRAHIRYGKMNLKVLYGQEYGAPISSWKIQRVIEKHGLYFHPKRTEALRKKRKANQIKKRITELKKEQRTGFLVALDTVVRYVAGAKRYILTGIDTHSKIAFARMYSTKHSKHAADFLKRLHYLFAARIENLQTDNGSEFAKEFREAARELSLPHYFSRPKTPTDNPFDERFNRTLQDEFIAMGNVTSDCAVFNKKLTEWLIEYNFKRPHQALGYEVPVEYHYKNQKVSPMYPSSTGA